MVCYEAVAAGIVAVARCVGMVFLARFGVATEGSSRQTAFAKKPWRHTDYKRKAHEPPKKKRFLSTL